MLTSDDKWTAFYLGIGYLAFAELSSLGATSRAFPCVLVSQYQAANNQSGYQACATVHEAVFRALVFIWNNAGHDNILAFGTIMIAVFTLTLWRANEKMWKVTNAALSLANDEFVSANRPRMRIKHMWLTHDTDWRLGGPLEINLDIVNVGNTEGLVTWVNYESILLPIGQRLPQRPPYDEMPFGEDMRITRFRTNAAVRAGVTLPRTVCDGRVLDDQEVLDVLHNRQKLLLIGTIEYFDTGIGLRQTGFCRRLTFATYPPAVGDLGRFDVENDRDYEFEEWVS